MSSSVCHHSRCRQNLSELHISMLCTRVNFNWPALQWYASNASKKGFLCTLQELYLAVHSLEKLKLEMFHMPLPGNDGLMMLTVHDQAGHCCNSSSHTCNRTHIRFAASQWSSQLAQLVTSARKAVLEAIQFLIVHTLTAEQCVLSQRLMCANAHQAGIHD